MKNYKGTLLQGVELYTFDVFKDGRGHFSSSYNQQDFNGIVEHNVNFIQDNESYSNKNVIRGLHFQRGVYAQAKLVRCVMGVINDVIVDLRNSSPTFGKYMSVELVGNMMLYVPKGFAHGFSVLSEQAFVQYKVDNYYAPQHDSGIRYDDPTLNIDWGVDLSNAIVSDKDKSLPNFEQTNLYF
jgi:dTDP-4-dehydrorhamnose 3,5-epimerase